ncbi:MAG: hypothetical protein HQ519_13925 [Planctomycetes bacterium]|nr:hypothetical protein [Planctomycetota bacterium]
MINRMRLAHTLTVLALFACTTAQDERLSPLEALKERAVYAEWNKLAIENLAHMAEVRWPQEFSGFAY